MTTPIVIYDTTAIDLRRPIPARGCRRPNQATPSRLAVTRSPSWVGEPCRNRRSDPVEGGSANDYDYCNADPVNCLDLAGTNPSHITMPEDEYVALINAGLNPIDYMGGGSDSVSFSSRPTDLQRTDAVLRPGGISIGIVGTRPSIRVVRGNQGTADELFRRLTEGGVVLPRGTYPGKQVRLPDGGIVGLRRASRSGGPAIDVNVPGQPITKIHFYR